MFSVQCTLMTFKLDFVDVLWLWSLLLHYMLIIYIWWNYIYIYTVWWSWDQGLCPRLLEFGLWKSCSWSQDLRKSVGLPLETFRQSFGSVLILKQSLEFLACSVVDCCSRALSVRSWSQFWDLCIKSWNSSLDLWSVLAQISGPSLKASILVLRLI